MATITSLKALAVKMEQERKDKLLTTCIVSNKKGGKPAIFILEMPDGKTETMRCILHPSIRTGTSFKGGTIRSIRRARLSASVMTTRMGKETHYYVNISAR